MKCYSRIILLAYLIFNSFFISAQPFDTLLTQFSSIREIAPLNDGTSILIGDRKNSVRVARIDSNAKIMWMRILTDTFFYISAEVEFHMHESDSTIQVVTKRTSCDIVLEGVANLFTLDFKGNIKDTVYIPLLSAYQRTYILSGNDTLPRCATIVDKKVILQYSNGDTIIITPDHEILNPRLVDMCPFGGLIITHDIGILRYYQKSGNNFHAVSGGYSRPDALQMICLDEKHIVYRFEDKILSTDTTGLGEYNSITSDNSFFYELVFNSPYIYAKSLSPVASDTFYVIDHEADLIYKESVDQMAGQK